VESAATPIVARVDVDPASPDVDVSASVVGIAGRCGAGPMIASRAGWSARVMMNGNASAPAQHIAATMPRDIEPRFARRSPSKGLPTDRHLPVVTSRKPTVAQLTKKCV
jgi:hypothetical protein